MATVGEAYKQKEGWKIWGSDLGMELRGVNTEKVAVAGKERRGRRGGSGACAVALSQRSGD